MNATTGNNVGARLGRLVGRACLRIKHWQATFRGWLIRAGCPPRIASVATVLVTILGLGVAAYLLSWLLIPVLVLCVIFAAFARLPDDIEWRFKQHRDHRKNTFYDPNAYTDDPDPRWDPPN